MPAHSDPFRKTPWWTFYAEPVKTYREILANYPMAYSIMMALVAGFAMMLQHLYSHGLARHDVPGSMMLQAFVFGPFFGLAVYYLAGIVLRIISARFGGKGSAEEHRTIWAWSFVPYLSGVVLLWIPLTIAMVVRARLWLHLPDWLKDGLLGMEIFLYYAFIPFWGWSLYIFVLGLTIINRYSWRSAILTTIIAYVAFGLVAWLLIIWFHFLGALIF
ncbi:YIP1 family protein [Rubellicoccus peritrichatus]|uniref:YIP1 family protein n=1 Tax=Rubellicoccus peritrichatus TaxID=3080537 RepID=A0AAQ3QV56_9BACT|nr:YIP1 family protein [Puniceicoccus sp. CR14]WOO41178.1 YIP1 family protein [Puniceicoccus sp. CR14]